MGIKVQPSITIDGQPIACTVPELDSTPTAIRGLEVQWGRGDYHDADGEPASLTIHLADATGQWASRIRTSTAIGKKVVVSWVGIPTTPGGIKVGPVVMFRGRIARAKAVPMKSTTSDGRRRWEITLTCADRVADYGNALAGWSDWPVESMLARAIKIRDLGIAAGSEIDQVYFWPGYVDSMTAPLEVKNSSALDLLGAFYHSMGNDTWAYDPDENVIRQVIRLSQPMTVHLGSFDDDLGAVYPVPSDITVDKKTYPGIALGGAELAGEPEINADPSTSINRLECSWKDHATDHQDWTTVRESVPAGDARRVMAWSSWLNNGYTIDPTLDNVWERVTEEGARPRHPQLTTKATHVFATERTARWILQTWENTRPAYIAGSAAYQWLMGDASSAYSPIVAPIGGSTTFDPERGWKAHLRVHWIHNTTPPGSPATWSSLIQKKVTSSTPAQPWWWRLLALPAPKPVTVGQPTPERDLTWGAAAEKSGYRWAESVTWGDLKHVPTTGTTIIDHLE